MSMYGRMWRLLAGRDSPTHRGLPCAELLAPLPLLALGLLAANDWLLKGSSAPAWLTGKLSDFAGLFVFPLVLTSTIDIVLLGVSRLGVAVDFTLRRWKLAAAIVLTGGVFTAIKLSPAAAAFVVRLLSTVTGPSHVVTDRTDLVALVVLVGTWFHGRRTLARGSYGRLDLTLRRRLRAPFADAIACGADPGAVAKAEQAITAWVAGGPAEPVTNALDLLRT